uniref:Cytochrome P450 monooxygenase BOT1 (Calcineurin-dependent protein 5)) n=1 Tax=Ganoderma boninense TaxID=34458 RepID=A0A5K1K658_9APHY|nr:Cytochrome P450 monooxygenase BOT1 (EC (Botrydial biosynthesis cluster protein 1) (Calcineurin-dependent protein 5) [Ganoderma boninense]
MPTFMLRDSNGPSEATQDHTEVRIFVAFQAIGGIGLLAVLLTVVLAPKVYRHFTWLNFCITWLIYCISYLLLAFTGAQTSAVPPSYPLCLTQASLIYAAPVLVAMSTFALVLQLWFTLSKALAPPKTKQRDCLRDGFLLISPYVAWLAEVVAILVVGTMHPKDVERSSHFVYCTISTGRPGNITAGIVAGILLVMVGFDVYIGAVLYKNWRALHKSDHPFQIPLSLLIRVALFSLVCVIGIGCAFVFLAGLSAYAGNVIIGLSELHLHHLLLPPSPALLAKLLSVDR